MSEGFDLQTYLANGVEKVVTDAIRATLKNPRELVEQLLSGKSNMIA